MSAFIDAEMLGVVTEAFEEAWSEAQTIIGSPPANPNAVRALLADRIMEAVNSGERAHQPVRLPWAF
jgi:hypothetical protein